MYSSRLWKGKEIVSLLDTSKHVVLHAVLWFMPVPRGEDEDEDGEET